MALKRWTGSEWVDLTNFKRWTGSEWVDITNAKRWTGSEWVDLEGFGSGGGGGTPVGLQATITGFAQGTYSCNLAFDISCPFIKAVTTTSVTVNTSGGTGAGPTFSWQYVSGDSSITPTAPTAATTAFTGAVNRNSIKTAVFKCVVTQGVETREVMIDVFLQYDYVTGGLEP